MMRHGVAWVVLAAGLLAGPTLKSGRSQELAGPTILFVTQVPIPADFTTIGSVFGNHRAELDAVGRGGDLWIRYPDGTLKNLTAAAGYGHDGLQGRTAIAVRDPSVHWDGARAVFSMVVGAPARRYEVNTYYWQLYEISGLAPHETPQIQRVPHQPEQVNNVSPIYATDGRILFTSDRSRTGDAHLYPQLDEYEEAPTVTGLWSLDPASGELTLLVHAPSGVFTPRVDSFGRVVFTQWDHLERDQQADADALNGDTYGTFDWSDESAAAVPMADRMEIFPEPRPVRRDLLAGTNLTGHRFNHFLPWTVREDGTEHETLAHLGRHELHAYANRSITDDPNVVELLEATAERVNPAAVRNILQIREDPRAPGRYVGVDAPEFYTHTAGQVVALDATPADNPDAIVVVPVTHPDTANVAAVPSPDHSGLYRDPLPLTTGDIVVVHTAETGPGENLGTRREPRSRHEFRLRWLDRTGDGYAVAGAPLTGGIHKTVSYYDPDELVTYSGPLWELSPVEVRARPRPVAEPAVLPLPEADAFRQAGVDAMAVRAWLAHRGLALIVSRNVTTRDGADRQQPFNLRVAGSSTRTTGAPGTVYEVAHLQIFQADQLRSLGGTVAPRPGRRVLARALHDPAAANPPGPGPAGSVAIAPDGSVAAFVPARRALSWQLTDPQGNAVVRERYWVSLQPGEIRVCASCHGVNTADQAGRTEPVNTPAALVELLRHWRALQP